MSFLKFWEELEAIKPLDLSGFCNSDFDEEEYNEYLDQLDEHFEQELPEDYKF